MNVSVILGHPNPLSFNHAIAHAALHVLKGLGHTIFYHDLYAEGFYPNLPLAEFDENAELPADIRNYCEELRSSNGIIVVHPNWWGQPPAILKGWVDRVMRPGVTYKFDESDKGEGVPIGLLKAKVAVIFTTSNTPPDREQNVFGDPLENIWKSCIFNLCGVEAVHRKNFEVIVTSTEEERKRWLDNVKLIIEEYF